MLAVAVVEVEAEQAAFLSDQGGSQRRALVRLENSHGERVYEGFHIQNVNA